MIWPDESVTTVKRGTNHKLNKIEKNTLQIRLVQVRNEYKNKTNRKLNLQGAHTTTEKKATR